VTDVRLIKPLALRSSSDHAGNEELAPWRHTDLAWIMNYWS
jgi:hypothetical protein